MAQNQPLVYLNGRFVPPDKATISVLDRGFLFGDGVYEVIPAYRGKLFRLDQHLNRLEASLKKIRMKSPMTHSEWENVLNKLLIDKHDQFIYLHVSRGIAKKRDLAIPEESEPTVFAQSTILSPVKVPANGLRAITVADSRWHHCDIKAVTLLANILVRQQAIDSNCSEAILIRDGHITEGAASNVFVVKDNVLLTPPKSQYILPGITRDLVLELAQKNNISTKEIGLSLDQLRKGDEIWLTSSTREILPITDLDDRPIGNGKIGPLWYRIVDVFSAFKRSLE